MATTKTAAHTVSPDCIMQECWRCSGTYSKYNLKGRGFDPAKKWIRVACNCPCHAKGAKQ